MFATRDQENLVHNHQQLAASKPLNASTRNAPPKTPGNQYPKTPLKIPIRDENAPTMFKGTKGKAAATQFVTPMGAKTTRAPLGAKTTNAKTKALQTPAFNKPTSTRRPKQRISQADTLKIEVHGDVNVSGQLAEQEREPEYCPPSVPYPAYESDDFPDGCIDYTPITGANLMRGFQEYFHNPRDENGNSIIEKRREAAFQKARDEEDARIMAAIDEIDWSVSDAPATQKVFRDPQPPVQKKGVSIVSKPVMPYRPGTAVSRKAAATLAHAGPASIGPVKTFTSKPPTIARGPTLLTKNRSKPAATADTISASMRSRNTIGYTKGRTASNVLHGTKSSMDRTQAQPARPVKVTPASDESLKATNGLYDIYDLALGDGRAGNGDDHKLSDEVARLNLDDDDDIVDRSFDPRAEDEEDKDFVFVLNGA